GARAASGPRPAGAPGTFPAARRPDAPQTPGGHAFGPPQGPGPHGPGPHGAAAHSGRPVPRGPAPARPPGPSATSHPAVPRQRGTERGPGQRVGNGDIAALHSVGDLFRALDNAYGGGHARQALVRYLEHETEPMLRGTYTEAVGRRLFSAAADLTRLAGWTSYDIGAHGLAQRYFVQALRLAQAAGDRAYGAFVLVTMSRQAVYLGHGREAVQLARVAQQGIGSAAPPVVLALLHAVEARGHGVLGETRACVAALVRAERALQSTRTGDEAPSWARHFDEAQLADEFGHCHRDLQQYRAAAQHAERSLQLRAPAYARSRLFCRVVLATARLGLGELDQACLLGAEAAQQAAEMRSVRAAEYVRDFERRLEPYRDAVAVRGYRDRVASLG
ncbi:regulator, partial [Streptomyces nitrosporeus]